jgi:hypothetical protein
MVVRCQGSDESGTVLVEAEFTVVPLSPEKFVRIAGIDALPPNWAALFAAP